MASTMAISSAAPIVLNRRSRAMLLAGVLAVGIVAVFMASRTPQPLQEGTAAPKSAASRHPGGRMPDSARKIYAMTWGVDQLSAQLAQSGQLVRFNYRVTDAAKAQALNDRASTPYLLDEAAHAVLEVPVMDKVGPLRQSTPAEVGKRYWMVFSNTGQVVKAGHRVSVVIGGVRVDGLVVQ